MLFHISGNAVFMLGISDGKIPRYCDGIHFVCKGPENLLKRVNIEWGSLVSPIIVASLQKNNRGHFGEGRMVQVIANED